jgi:uncharacterized membrane protein YdjX (TVP38/TMEM64 family)
MKPDEKRVKRLLMASLGVLLILAALFLLKGLGEGHFSSAERLRTYIGTFGLFGPVVLTLIQMLQVVLPVLPGFLGCVVGAGLFGTTGGFLCNYIGISAGSLIAFLLARHLGMPFVRQVVSQEQYDRYVGWLAGKRYYTLVLGLAILLPLAPDDFLCYFSGLTGMSFRKFTWIILLAKPWCILAYSVACGSLIPFGG